MRGDASPELRVEGRGVAGGDVLPDFVFEVWKSPRSCHRSLDIHGSPPRLCRASARAS